MHHSQAKATVAQTMQIFEGHFTSVLASGKPTQPCKGKGLFTHKTETARLLPNHTGLELTST